MIKKLTALFIMSILILSVLPALAATDYDEEGIYEECYTLYPDFVNKIKDKGVTDKQVISFLQSVEKHLIEQDEELSEENFDQYMFDSIKYAFNLRKHISVRDALAAAFPSAVPDAMDGIVPEAFMPIYNTVKRFLFGIKTPITTISFECKNDETVVYAHSAHLEEDCNFVLAVYDDEGVLLHTKFVTPNVEEDGLHCTCSTIYSAKLFAWDKESLAPICDSYEVITAK